MSNQKREALLAELISSATGPRGSVGLLDAPEIAQALGVSEGIPISGLSEGFALYRARQASIRTQVRKERATQALAVEAAAQLAPRLQSTGGRPTVPEWTVDRLTAYDPDIWEQLQNAASVASTEGRKISPSQIASYLIEKSLGDYISGVTPP